MFLRPYADDDFGALFAIRSRPDVARYLYWEAQIAAEAHAPLEEKIASVAIRSEGDVLAAVLKATNELVGDLVLEWASEEHLQGEIGFIIHPDQ